MILLLSNTQLFHPLNQTPTSPPFQPRLNLRNQIAQRDNHTVFLGMALRQAELLDLALALGLLIIAEDNGVRDGAGLGGFKLCLDFGFELVGEFGLGRGGLENFSFFGGKGKDEGRREDVL